MKELFLVSGWLALFVVTSCGFLETQGKAYPYPLLEQRIEMRQETEVDVEVRPAPIHVAPPNVNVNIEAPGTSSWMTAGTMEMASSHDCLMDKEECRYGVQVDTESIRKRGDIVDFKARLFCLRPDGTSSFRCKTARATFMGMAWRAKCSTEKQWIEQKWTSVNDGAKMAIRFACEG
jgi:hypothetical protein